MDRGRFGRAIQIPGDSGERGLRTRTIGLREELLEQEKYNLESLDLAKFTTINHIHTCKKRRVTL